MKLISIEGLDGCGKTTIVNLLKEQGFTSFHEIPKVIDDTMEKDLGYRIRAKLQSGRENTEEFRKELALDYVELRQGYQPLLEQLLFTSDLIVDRGILSTLVYGYADKDFNEDLATLNFNFRLPDLTLFLDISIDDVMERLNSRSDSSIEVYKNIDTMFETHKRYMEIIGKYHKILNIKLINASQTPDKVLQECLQVIKGS